MQQALKGIKVADFSWNAVGPIAVRYLAQFGATVVHIESESAPDASRFVPPYKDDVVGLNRAPFWTEFNTNKYGMALDLNHPRAKEVAIRLVKWADIVNQSYAPGRMAKWGLSYEDIRKVNPGVIMCSASMQGQTGPHAVHRGFGNQLVGGTGFSHILGYPNDIPLQPYGAYTDWIGARFGAVAILGALDYRRRTGKGQHLDLSQFEAACHFLSPLLLNYAVNEREVERRGNSSSYAAPHSAYRCKGKDRWCVIAVFTEEEWANFCHVLGDPNWTKDDRFSTLPDRKKHEAELDRLVGEWTINYSCEEVMNLMQDAKVPAGVVATAEDLFNDPQLKYYEHFYQVDHREIGRHAADGIGFNLSRTPHKIDRAGPCLGEHTAYVCTELLGMADEEFAELASVGVFR